jgi:hypothetical protein
MKIKELLLAAADPAVAWAMDSNRYSVWQLPYGASGEGGEGLRPAIKVELNYAPMRKPTVLLPVRSFVAEAMGRPPEVPVSPASASSRPPPKNWSHSRGARRWRWPGPAVTRT